MLNASLEGVLLDQWAIPDPDAALRLRREMEHGRLTGRGYHRVRRSARTIADLAGRTDAVLSDEDITVALSMRAVIARRAHAGAA